MHSSGRRNPADQAWCRSGKNERRPAGRSAGGRADLSHMTSPMRHIGNCDLLQWRRWTMKRISRKYIGVIGLLLVCSPASTASSQVAAPSMDSLVATFIEMGPLSPWRPHQLCEGCPDLDSRQRRGISLLMSADLSLERTDQLASAWASPLVRCADPTLEQWYFDTMSELIREDKLGQMSRFRRVLG